VDEVNPAIPGGVAAWNDKHQLTALELLLNLAEDTALNLHKKSAARCGSTECAGSAIFADWFELSRIKI
jgi:hypothetical protein